ncbi:MAG: carboxypeptidase regulatory-like domain-containing protein [Acidobacteria bacterium]|nr:carboxypeptidase regulatory-like domain-containing protein [Acidobacteriota bacterium]
MRSRVTCLLALLLAASLSTRAYAQGSFFSSLSGIVIDAQGGVIPGADVKIQNNGTGETVNVVTAIDGGFTASSLPGGIYSVTVTLSGFKTVVLNEVTLNASVPASVKVTLQVGTVAENVTVVGDSALVVQTQTPSISTNLSSAQITSLPLTSRNALDSLTSLPGFNTSGTARNSTISGLPKSAINITLDGMNIQDNYLKTSDGYFARLTPTLDSVEEVTVTTAGNTADATGQGGVQIKFVTKSGTNSWVGTAYEYLRHDWLNANTWFNNRDLPPDPSTGKAPKATLRDYQQGFAQGGPIIKNKAFFFFNYEEERRPANTTLQRTVLRPEAAAGIFSYNVAGSVRQVNLLQLAATNGQLATLDPTVAKALGDIRAATGTTGSLAALSNPLVQQYTFQADTNNFNPAPTFRIDYDLSERHRLTGSMNYRHINSTPDGTNNAYVPFPGLPQTGSQQSTRWTTSESLRSTFTANLVNEFRVGGTGGATLFSPELDPSMWSGTGGVRLNLFGACCGSGFQLTNLNTGVTATSGGAAQYSAREASTKVIEDTATWIRGKHSVSFGGSMVQADVWLLTHTMVPTANFGIVSTEAANAMFSATNFPGASTTDITNATNLYAMLTGRLTSLAGDARINASGDAYVPLGESRAEGRMREFDFYVADSWRATPGITVSGGLRYALALPFYPANNSYTTVTDASLYGVSGVGNLFLPGTLAGTKPNFVQYPAGTYAYNTDRNNLAPSGGVAWQVPGQDNRIGRVILGSQEGDSVIRGGLAMAFQRPGMSDFTGVFGANQGISVTLQRDNSNATLPILLRNNATLPSAPSATYPILPTSLTNTVNMFDSNLQLPYTQSYTVGWQRKVGRDTAIELRYVGSRHRQDWETVNINEISITDNGFLPEFRKAQANLQANIAAGRGNTFAYTGAPGTSPLPIFLAFLNGIPGSQASDATKYTGTNWTNANFLGYLAAMNPNPFGFMCNNAPGCSTATLTTGFIGNTAFRNNAAAAGLPANFFLANPDVIGGANLTTNSGGTRSNSVQFEFRKRMSKGLQLNTSYAWGQAWVAQRYGFTKPTEDLLQVGQVGGVQHAFKANWLYELPFGRDRRWGGSASSFMDGLVGGWSIDGVARIQTGEMLDFGNVRLVGMSRDEFAKAVDLRVGSNGQLYILPDDIVQNTVKAFSVLATSPNGYSALGAPTGRYLAPANGPDCIETAPAYGDCGIRSLVVNGPQLIRFDLSAVKRVKLHGNVNFEFRAELLNAFNKPYFNPASTAGTPLGMTTSFTGPGGPTATGTPLTNSIAGSSADSFRLTSLLGDNTARIIQLVWRVRW